MLNISIPTIVFQIINFIILAVALYFLLFRKVTRSVKKRAEQKEQLLKEIEQNRLESERVLQEYNEKMANISQEVEQILRKTRENLEIDYTAAISELEKQTRRRLHDVEEEIQSMNQLAAEQFFDRILNQVIETSRSVITRTVPANYHNQLVQQLVEEIWRLGREELPRVTEIRASLQEVTPVLHVDTAIPLTIEQQGLIIRAFSALADRNVDFKMHKAPHLGAGCRVRIGDLSIDNSIDSQLEQLREIAADELRERLALKEPK